MHEFRCQVEELSRYSKSRWKAMLGFLFPCGLSRWVKDWDKPLSTRLFMLWGIGPMVADPPFHLFHVVWLDPDPANGLVDLLLPSQSKVKVLMPSIQWMQRLSRVPLPWVAQQVACHLSRAPPLLRVAQQVACSKSRTPLLWVAQQPLSVIPLRVVRRLPWSSHPSASSALGSGPRLPSPSCLSDSLRCTADDEVNYWELSEWM